MLDARVEGWFIKAGDGDALHDGRKNMQNAQGCQGEKPKETEKFHKSPASQKGKGVE